MTWTEPLQHDLEQGHVERVKSFLQTLLPVELSDLFAGISTAQQVDLIALLPIDKAARTFEFLPFNLQKELIKSMSSDKAAALLNDLSPDDRVAFFEELPSPVVNQLIKLLNPEERSNTLVLLGYPERSVGRLMTPDYLAIKPDWTVQQALDYIHINGRDSETVNILYILDNAGHLIDDISIRQLLLSEYTKKISDVSDRKFIALKATDPAEAAINIFRKNNRAALPVVDNDGYLLGIVTIDDILNLARREEIEDIQRIGGSYPLEQPYMSTPFFALMRKRAGWLVLLFLGEMLTATAMGYFEGEISKAVVLALFLPLIMSSGGNSGSQASTLIICALSLGEVTFKDWWRIMRREISAGLFLGAVLGTIALFRVTFWTFFTPIYGEHWFLIALTVGFALVGVVTWGTLIGSMLPLILKKLGADPAVSSAPFVATLIDVTGIVIYFMIALIILKGTLL